MRIGGATLYPHICADGTTAACGKGRELADAGFEETFADWLGNVNWGLLAAQKDTLARLVDSGSLTSEEEHHVEGLLNLLSSLQDWAVDKECLGEVEVFGAETV